MKDVKELAFHKNVWLIPMLFIFVIWFVYWIEIQYGFNFNKYGVYPREIRGLRGVVFSHFIHSSTSHLFNNSIPLFVLSSALFYFYRKVAFHVLIYGAIISELITWLIGRESYHIGASGVVYVLFSFLLFSGVIRKHFRLIALSMIVIFLYGSMVWYILPIKEGMSWEGHLGGFISGLGFAFLYRKRGIVKEEYQFSKTAFDELFDEDGNLIQDDSTNADE